MIKTPIFHPTFSSMESGSLVIQREGDQFSFYLIENDEEKLLHRLTYSAASVRNVKVICARQSHGNGTASYLLKKLHLETEGFYAFENANGTWFTWWRLLIALHIVVLASLVVRAARKQS